MRHVPRTAGRRLRGSGAMIKVAQWMWSCEPGVAVYQVEHAAMLQRPPLGFVDLTPNDPSRKRLAILDGGRKLLDVWCSPVHDTCVEVYVDDPIPLADRDRVMGFVGEIEARGLSLKLIRRPLGFTLDTKRA